MKSFIIITFCALLSSAIGFGQTTETIVTPTTPTAKPSAVKMNTGSPTTPADNKVKENKLPNNTATTPSLTIPTEIKVNENAQPINTLPKEEVNTPSPTPTQISKNASSAEKKLEAQKTAPTPKPAKAKDKNTDGVPD